MADEGAATSRVSADAALHAVIAALTAAGTPHEHAAVQADALVDAELRGLPSHGLLRLPRIVARIANGVTDPSTRGRHAWDGAALLRVDGENGLGPVVAMEALTAASRRCVDSTGVAVAAVHSCNHLGSLAYYARRVASSGLACIALTTSEAIMHPFGGRRAMIGSNPVAVGVPAGPRSFVVDLATTEVPMGKIHDHANRRVPLDPGWALDEDGEPTTDADRAKDGSIAPFGGAKGYALGLAFEVLVTALTGAALGRDVGGTLDSTRAANKGDVFIVFRSGSGSAISDYLDAVRASPSAEEGESVRVPGDASDERRDKAVSSGIDVPTEIWDQIRSLGSR